MRLGRRESDVGPWYEIRALVGPRGEDYLLVPYVEWSQRVNSGTNFVLPSDRGCQFHGPGGGGAPLALPDPLQDTRLPREDSLMPTPPIVADTPYLSRPFRCVFPPAAIAQEVRALLAAGGVELLPEERHSSRGDVILLAAGADLEHAASLLREYQGWPADE